MELWLLLIYFWLIWSILSLRWIWIPCINKSYPTLNTLGCSAHALEIPPSQSLWNLIMMGTSHTSPLLGMAARAGTVTESREMSSALLSRQSPWNKQRLQSGFWGEFFCALRSQSFWISTGKPLFKSTINVYTFTFGNSTKLCGK